VVGHDDGDDQNDDTVRVRNLPHTHAPPSVTELRAHSHNRLATPTSTHAPFRPLLVDMRLRKPCFAFRRSTLGWYVRFWLKMDGMVRRPLEGAASGTDAKSASAAKEGNARA
jgi:hypothetical protein